QSRQEMCETLPWFRSFHGGVYHKNGVVKGYLLSRFGSQRDCFLHGGKLIISHGGGGRPEDENGRIGDRVKDQRQNDPSVRALINNHAAGTPLVLLVDDEYPGFPLRLKDRGIDLTVLGFYAIVAAWAESHNINGTNVVRYKFAFQWCAGQGELWWLAQPTETSSKCAAHSPPDVYRCVECGNPSPHIFLQDWVCLNPNCSQFWARSDGRPSGQLDYNSEFLELRQPPEFPSGFETRLVPEPPILTSADQFTTSFEHTRGWNCHQCGRVSSRYGSSYIFQVTRVSSIRTAWEKYEYILMATDGGFASHSHCRIISSLLRNFLHENHLLNPSRGTIHHIRGNNSLNDEADSLFEEYQIEASAGSLLFRRWPLKKVRTHLPPFFPYFFVGFVSVPLQYVAGSSITVPFEKTSKVVVDSHHLIQTRVAAALGPKPHFNEALTVLYLEKQSMAGDILVMDGAGVQDYYQSVLFHSQSPQNFRIAVTARQIGPENHTSR
ncbi:hypothetical protein B0H11DRAFT_1704762, partial [Mycena galericulata]